MIVSIDCDTKDEFYTICDNFKDPNYIINNILIWQFEYNEKANLSLYYKLLEDDEVIININCEVNIVSKVIRCCDYYQYQIISELFESKFSNFVKLAALMVNGKQHLYYMSSTHKQPPKIVVVVSDY